MSFAVVECVLICTHRTRQDAVLPLSGPIQGVDDSEISDVFVPKNTEIVVGIKACNTDKDIWGDDAYEWKPERWLSGLPASVSDARVPGVYANLLVFDVGRGLAVTLLMYEFQDDFPRRRQILHVSCGTMLWLTPCLTIPQWYQILSARD